MEVIYKAMAFAQEQFSAISEHGVKYGLAKFYGYAISLFTELVKY